MSLRDDMALLRVTRAAAWEQQLAVLDADLAAPLRGLPAIDRGDCQQQMRIQHLRLFRRLVDLLEKLDQSDDCGEEGGNG